QDAVPPMPVALEPDPAPAEPTDDTEPQTVRAEDTADDDRESSPADDSSRPATADPDMVEPDTVEPDTVNPDTVEPDIVEPDTTDPDMVQPDPVNPDMVNPDMVEPDMVEPDRVDLPADSILESADRADVGLGPDLAGGPTGKKERRRSRRRRRRRRPVPEPAPTEPPTDEAAIDLTNPTDTEENTAPDGDANRATDDEAVDTAVEQEATRTVELRPSTLRAAGITAPTMPASDGARSSEWSKPILAERPAPADPGRTRSSTGGHASDEPSGEAGDEGDRDQGDAPGGSKQPSAPDQPRS
ncbi:MAG: hypothetical protein ACR2QK_21030, partial [Acidimicrobiales bacterium]